MKLKAVVLPLLLVIFMASAFTLTNQPLSDGGYEIGEVVENFKLQNIDGEWVELNDYNDQEGVIVIFTCNSCPYAILYEDRIIELHEKYADKGYPVVAINPNDPEMKPADSYDEMKVRADEKGFSFPYLFDKEQDVFPKFGAQRTPHVFLLDKNDDNQFQVEYIGAIDDNAQDASSVNTRYVENAISAIQNNETPDPTTTKAIGCGIKKRAS